MPLHLTSGRSISPEVGGGVLLLYKDFGIKLAKFTKIMDDHIVDLERVLC